MQTALQRVDGRGCVRAALAVKGLAAPVWVAAVGKAATAMALGAHDALGNAIERTLIITRDAQPLSDFPAGARPEVCFGAHPVPDERSLKAGARLVEWVDTLPAHVQVLFLISGGASALVEVPAAGKTLRDLETLTREALASGIDINELNARRAALSDIKGGRLAARLHGRPARALFISDVPHDDPRVIGSGLMGPAPGAADHIERQVVASIEHALEALAAQGTQLGLKVHVPPTRFEGEAMRLAARFAHELRLTSAQLCAWGGESTVRLPAQPGSGGRNQHLALAAARLIAGHADLLLLAAGTDGSDGVTADAGALVDGDSWARITLAGIDADACIRQADSARALAGSGDLVHTGPTGTNVGDLVIGLKLSLADAHTVTQPHGGDATRVL